MNGNTTKIIEINCASTTGFDDAVQCGLSKVAETVKNIKGAWISDQKVCTAPDGKIQEWRVCMRVSFIVE